MNKLTGDRDIRSIMLKLKDGVNAQVAEQSIIEVLKIRRGSKDFLLETQILSDKP